MSAPIAAHLLSRTAGDPADLLSAHVRFRSPFADYCGRGTIARLLRVMPSVFDELTFVRAFVGEDGASATLLHGRIGDEPVDVMIEERVAADGTVTDAMLLTRPLPATKAAISRMGSLLAGQGIDPSRGPSA